VAIVGCASANNLLITTPTLVDHNAVTGVVDARFNISWQNSWRTSAAPGNWDAAWVFIKFRVGMTDPMRTGVSSTGTTLNVGSTALLRVGMPVVRTAGTGAFAANTVITAIPNATQVTISAAPTTALAGASVRLIRIWEHARLGDDPAHVAPAGSTIRTGRLNPAAAYNATTNYGVGAFIYRSTNGTGTFSANNVELRWNLGTQGLGTGGPIEVCAFGHEMVYVTGGSFRVGMAATPTGNSAHFFTQPNVNSTYLVANESAITIGTTAGNLWYNVLTGIGGDQQGPVPAAYPKGTAAFYCMKYEISQGDYVDFLNKLTRGQQSTKTATLLSEGITAVTNRFVLTNTMAVANRNGVRCAATVSAVDPITFYSDLDGDGNGNEANDGRWIACNYIAWQDVAAYLDWSGLRPLSELEYEKVCRGPVTPVANEYAWGNSLIGGIGQYALANPGTASEQISANYATSAGNAVWFGALAYLVGGAGGVLTYVYDGPFRVGTTAHHASNTGRLTAGAGYYGSLDLSGNVGEVVVHLGNAAGRAYTGTHGNGTLTSAGAHDAASWPTTGAAGAGYRGGDWSSGTFPCQTSNRSAVLLGATNGVRERGGRGIRTAP
jgi:formylglycine-generating enzyme required for sulfatase activity